MKNHSFWVSTPKMTGLIETDSNGRIVKTAPIFKVFKNQHIYNFNIWLDSRFNEEDVKVEEIV